MLIDEKEKIQTLMRAHMVILSDLTDVQKAASKLREETDASLDKLETSLNAD